MVVDELRKKWALASGIATTEFEHYFNLGRHGLLECTVIDDASLEVLERILALADRLKSSDDKEERRSFWMCVVEDDEDYKADGYLDRWYMVTVAKYRGHYSIVITDRSYQGVAFANVKLVGDKREDVKQGWNIKILLEAVEKYLIEVLADVPAYNKFVHEYLPYDKRVGVISRRELVEILPSYNHMGLVGDNEALEILDWGKEERPCGIEKMTLREYARLWNIGYRAYCKSGETERKEPVEENSFESFKKHSSEGYKLVRDNGGYDPDNEADFVRWMHDSSPYHSLDICYARIHFTPERREEDGKWCLTLHCHAYGWLRDVITIARAYKEAGVEIQVEPNDKIRQIVNAEDLVRFSPCPGKYIGYGDVTNDTHLPCVGEGEDCVSQEVFSRLISATRWDEEGDLELVEEPEHGE